MTDTPIKFEDPVWLEGCHLFTDGPRAPAFSRFFLIRFARAVGPGTAVASGETDDRVVAPVG